MVQNMMWSGAVHNPVRWEGFSGGFFTDPDLPYAPEDFFTVSMDYETLVLMSGVIYNDNELISQLAIKEQKIPHPQLVLASFMKWGEKFVTKLNGDFAILIYQRKADQIFLFRDHLGIKPIAYSVINETLWVSSDYYSLCKTLYRNYDIDKEFIRNCYFGFGRLHSIQHYDCSILPNSMVKNVMPGHYIRFINGTVNDEKYWNPESISIDSKIDFEIAKNTLEELVSDAVKIRADKRFLASAHVSGGLDSGIVSTFVRKEYDLQSEFFGFCWSPPDAISEDITFDERKLAALTCKNAGISPVFITIKSQDHLKYLSGWRNTGDSFYEIKVREIAKQKHINLIFSGWGGDEFLSFDNYGIDTDLIFNLQLRSFFKRNSIKSPKKIISTLLYGIILPAFSIRSSSLRKAFTSHSKYLKTSVNSRSKTLNDHFFWRSRRDVHLNLLNDYHITQRLDHWSINGIRSGIEYRYPLLDKRIIEYMLAVPSKVLFKDGVNRILLREIGNGILPDEIRWHVSKNDPVRVKKLYDLLDEVNEQLMDEVERYKANPDFNFIRFDLLEEDILKYRRGESMGRPCEQFTILFFLKMGHEFAQSYYN